MVLHTNDIKLFVQYVVPKISSIGTYNIYKRDKNKWLKERFESFKRHYKTYKNAQINDLDLKKVIVDVDLQYSISQGMQNVPLVEAVRILSEGKIDINVFYRNVGITRLRNEPTIWYGPSTSSGHYDANRNRIYIDIRKDRALKQRMKTLEFEIVNASHRDARKLLATGIGKAEAKAWKSIKLEYQVSKLERDKILRINKVNSIEELVEKMGITQYIPQMYKNTPPIYNASKIKTERIKMPELNVLRDKDKRTALFWFLVRKWKDDQIIQDYAYRPHTPGVSKESTLEQEIRKYQK